MITEAVLWGFLAFLAGGVSVFVPGIIRYRGIRERFDREKKEIEREREFIESSWKFIKENQEDLAKKRKALEEFAAEVDEKADSMKIAQQIAVCKAKEAFRSKREAEFAAATYYLQSGIRLASYRCPVCPNFHHTSSKSVPDLALNTKYQKETDPGDRRLTAPIAELARIVSSKEKENDRKPDLHERESPTRE